MTSSRIVAIVLVLGAAAWIGSGHLGDRTAAQPIKAQAVEKLFRVTVAPATVEQHARRFTVSGRTEADRRTRVTARTTGTVTEILVKRGTMVTEGQTLAVLSDEAREANVAQAKARVGQRRQEFDARKLLVEQGSMPRLNLSQFEAELRSAEASLATAEAERERGIVTAPITGVVNDLPVEIGQSVSPGGQIAEVIALDPMIAVVEVSERRIGSINVGDKAQVRLATDQVVEGAVRFVSSRATAQTRTYRVDITIANVDGRIPDGITAEVSLRLAPTPSTRVPRSALTFSSDGKLGIRAVTDQSRVVFVPVGLVEDQTESVWVSGIADGMKIIVQGQDFVKEGQAVEAVPAVKA